MLDDMEKSMYSCVARGMPAFRLSARCLVMSMLLVGREKRVGKWMSNTGVTVSLSAVVGNMMRNPVTMPMVMTMMVVFVVGNPTDERIVVVVPLHDSGRDVPQHEQGERGTETVVLTDG